MNLAVQRPPAGAFSYADLEWVEVQRNIPPAQRENCQQQSVVVRQAKVRARRAADFISGEESRGGCNFQSTRTRPTESGKFKRRGSFLEGRDFHCGFEPEDDRLKAKQPLGAKHAEMMTLAPASAAGVTACAAAARCQCDVQKHF